MSRRSSRAAATATATATAASTPRDGLEGLVYAGGLLVATVVSSPVWWAALQGRRDPTGALTVVMGALVAVWVLGSMLVRLVAVADRLTAEEVDRTPVVPDDEGEG